MILRRPSGHDYSSHHPGDQTRPNLLGLDLGSGTGGNAGWRVSLYFLTFIFMVRTTPGNSLDRSLRSVGSSAKEK